MYKQQWEAHTGKAVIAVGCKETITCDQCGVILLSHTRKMLMLMCQQEVLSNTLKQIQVLQTIVQQLSHSVQ